MVDAQPAAMGEVGAQHFQEGGVAVLTQAARRKHRHAPVLAERVVQVRRRAGMEAGQDFLLAGPRLAAARVGADRQVADHAHRHAGVARSALRTRHAIGGEPLQEGVVGHVVGVVAGKGRHRGVGGRAQRDRPAAPVRGRSVVHAIAGHGEPLRLDRFIAGMRMQCRAAAGTEGGAVVQRRAWQQRIAPLPEPVQHGVAQRRQCDPVDFRERFQRRQLPADAERRNRRLQRLLAEHRGGIGVQRVQEQPAGGRVRAVALRQRGKAGMQRVDRDRVGVQGGSAGAAPGQRGQVAHAAVGAAAQAVELHREPPWACAGAGGSAAGAAGVA
ncbi:hypothetical protein FQZ97_521250 [compost metagenome]